MLTLSVFPLPIRFLSSASLPVLATQPLFLPFRSSRLCLAVASPARPSAFASLALPVLSDPVSRAFFPGSRTRLPVCFLSPFPDSLPQLFLRCLPHALAFGLSPSDSLSFVRFSLGSDYSAFRSFFSLLPVFPWRRFPRCFFPLPSGLLPCRPSDSGTQLSAIPFSVRRFASQKLPQRPDPCGRFPLAYALGAGYSAF